LHIEFVVHGRSRFRQESPAKHHTQNLPRSMVGWLGND
jgi:hypothetical protein